MGPCTTKQPPAKTTKAPPARSVPRRLPFHLLELLNSLSPFHIQQLHLRYKMHAPGKGLFPDVLPSVFPFLQQLPERLRSSFFSALDLDQDGVITFPELCIAAAVGTLRDVPQTLAYLFRIVDLKEDNAIDGEEVATVLCTPLLVLESTSSNALEASKAVRAAVPSQGLDFEHFKQWAKAHLNILESAQFLRILSTPQEECNEFARLFEAHLDLVEGETWHLVSTRWLARWAKYCNFDLQQLIPRYDPQIKTLDDLSPFPLDNSDLEDPMSPQSLVETARQGADFCPVHSEVWEFLVRTYGGGPAFPRKVALFEGRLTVSLFPAAVKVYRLQGDSYNKNSPTVLMLPLNWTVRRTKEEVRAVLQLQGEFLLMLRDQQGWARVVESCSLEECAAAGGALRALCVPASSEWYGHDRLMVTKSSLAAKSSPVRHVRLSAHPQDLDSVSLRGVNLLLLTEEELQESVQGLLPLPADEVFQGFPNLSNSCYLNAVLEVLAHTPLLSGYIRAQAYLNRLNVKKTPYLVHMMSILFRLMRNKSGGVPDTEEFLMLLGQKVPTFEEMSEQHDSYECLNAVIDVLHTELKQGEAQPLVKEISTPTKGQESAACKELYTAMRSAGFSYVSDLFSNILKSEIFCDVCGFRKVTINSAFSVYLPVPVASVVQLRVSVLFLNGEILHVGLEADLRDSVHQVLEGVAALAGVSRAVLKLISFRERRVFGIHLANTKVQDIVENSRGTLFAVECKPYRRQEPTVDQPPPPDTLAPDSPTAPQDFVSVKVIHRFTLRHKSHALPSAIAVPRVVTYGEIAVALDRYARGLNGDEKEVFKLMFLDFRNYKCCLCTSAKCEGCTLPRDDSRVEWEKMKGKAPAFVISWLDGEFNVRARFHQSYEAIEEKERAGFELSECLNLYTSAKTSEARCQRCSSELKTKEQLLYPADIVFICLERFTRYQNKLYKNKHFVKFPVEDLDLGKWVESEVFPVRTDMLVYDLYAVVNHEGSSSAGHNTVYCKADMRWVYCDDSRILEVTGTAEDRVVTSDAYILCYRRRHLSGRSVVQLTV